MEKIKLLELDIDIDALLKSTSDLKVTLDEVNRNQAALKKAGDTSSKQFVQNAADIKILNSAYNANLKAITESTQATTDQTNRSKLLELALSAEATSIKELRDQNSLLTRLRNESNIATEEGRKELALLNEKINTNNDLIKENADNLTKLKLNVGNYKDSIKEAFEELNIFNGGFLGFIGRAKEAGGVGPLVKGALSQITSGLIGVTKATLAFIATPIGALLAILVLAFALVKNAMNRSEEATNKITKVFSIFSGIANALFKVLEPLGEFLIDGIVAGFELAGKAADKALSLISDGLAFLGFDDAAKGVKEFTGAVKEGIKDAQNLADAEAELDKAKRAARLTQLEYQKDAEKLRQLRDDETKSIPERIALNAQLGEVLKKQLEEELRIAQVALNVANLRIKADGKTKENLDAQADALTEIADIQERLAGQESEQLASLNGLRKEAAAKQKELADEAEKRRQKALNDAYALAKAQLDLFLSEQGIKAKSIAEQIDLAEEVYKKQLDINQKSYNASAKTEADKLKLLTENNDARNALLQSQMDVVLANAENELSVFTAANKSKIDANKYLTDAFVEEEKRRRDLLLQEQLEYEALRLEQGALTTEQYNQRINELNEENRLNNEALDEERRVAKLEKDAIDWENQKEINALLFNDALAIKLAELETQKKAELASAEKTGADKVIINAKYALAEKKIRQEVEMAKLATIGGALEQAKGLFKENTAAFKAIAIAQATINTYQSAVAAYAAGLSLGGPAGLIAGPVFAGIAVAAGLGNIAKIAGVKLARGVIGLQGPGTGTSDSIPAQLSKGESVINARSTSMFAPLLGAINQAGGGRGYAGGAVGVGISNSLKQASESVIDYDLLGEKIVTAAAAIPPPVLPLEDFHAANGRYVDTIDGANH